jgi:hypothetical protein
VAEKACGNDGLIGELGLRSKTCSIFILGGERKFMDHFVVTFDSAAKIVALEILRKPRKTPGMDNPGIVLNHER